jgi:hypothetical protein
MLDHSTGTGTHTHQARGKEDCYETPDVAVQALLRTEKLPRDVWEPACGSGNIVRVLRAAGHHVVATDLYAYGCDSSASGIDFLSGKFIPVGGAIVTNPPYQHAQEFVEKALALSPLVIMLLRMAFYESLRRSNILDNGKLSRIHVFANRLPMMHRKGWNGPKASSAMTFAWFVWDRTHNAPTTIDRIFWKNDGASVHLHR